MPKKPGRPSKLRGKIGAREKHSQYAAEALALRIAGGTYKQIGERLHIHASNAYRAVQEELASLDAIKAERAERLRDLEVERCERLVLGLWTNATRGDDKSVHAVLRVMERKAKLLGIDAPTQVENVTRPRPLVVELVTDTEAHDRVSEAS